MANELADQVQSVAMQCGHIAQKQHPMNNGVIPVSIKNNRYYVRVSKHHISTVPYRGKVWCVTVPNSLVITRRNEKSIVTGNSTQEPDTPFVPPVPWSDKPWLPENQVRPK